MSLFANLVEVSRRVAATASRLKKMSELASFLRALPAGEIDIAVHYLTGETLQGRIGLGYATLRAAATAAAAREATLSIADVDHALAAVDAIRGAGSATGRADILSALFSRASADEQQFLLALLGAELRQGALAGIMVDAIAAAGPTNTSRGHVCPQPRSGCAHRHAGRRRSSREIQA